MRHRIHFVFALLALVAVAGCASDLKVKPTLETPKVQYAE